VNRDAARDVSAAISCAARRTATVVLRSAILADHVHVLISFRPDARISDFVRLAKTIAAFRANQRVAGTIKWARGFYAASVRKELLGVVDRYIAGQHDRHPDRIPQPGRRPG
jgi:REP element-mobilizing transposase RayT